MRTSIDLPDDLHREAKLTAVARGVPFKSLVAEGLAELLRGSRESDGEPSWKRHIGTLSKEAGDEMDRFLREADFSRVHSGESS